MITENQLLNHIHQTAQMGGEGIETVLKYADDPKLVQALSSQLREYRQMQRSACEMLRERGEEAKGVNPMAKVSSEMMSVVKTMTDHSATKIAEMMIQGNTMGVTKSIRTIRDCSLHDERVRDLANKLLKTEEANIEEMKRFL